MLVKITDFIWRFLLLQACHVYMTVIQPALTYEAIAWHQPQMLAMQKPTSVEIMGKLIKQQNKYL